MTFALTGPRLALFDDLRAAVVTDPGQVAIRDELSSGQWDAPWSVQDGLLLFGKCIYVPATSLVLLAILTVVHNTGHEGVQKTLQRLRVDFHVPRACQELQAFIRNYAVCQCNKTEHLHPASLL